MTKTNILWGLSIFLFSVAVWLAASALLFGNPYGYFALRGLRKSAVLLPFIIGGLTAFSKYLPLSNIKHLRPSVLICGLLLFWLFPLPVPALPALHSLELTADGPVEIRQIRTLDGTLIESDAFQLTEEWQLYDIMPGGVVLSVRHNVGAGKLSLLWDGDLTEIDLSAPQSVTTDIVMGSSDAAPGLLLLFKGFYALAYFALIFIFALIVKMRWPHPPR